MSPVAQEDQRERTARWLVSPAGAEAVTAARLALDDAPTDPLAAGSRLRRARPGLDPHHAAAALEQATLLRTARDRYGIAADLLLTRDGLEQGTRPDVVRPSSPAPGARGRPPGARPHGGPGLRHRRLPRGRPRGDGRRARCGRRSPSRAQLPGRRRRGGATPPIQPCSDRLLAGLGPDDVVFVDPARRNLAGPRDAASARARPERDPEPLVPAVVVSSRVSTTPASPPRSHPASSRAAAGRPSGSASIARWWSARCSPGRSPGRSAGRSVMTPPPPTVIAADPDRECARADVIGSWLHEPDPAVVARRGRAPRSPRRRGSSPWIATAAGSPENSRPAARPCAATSCWRAGRQRPAAAAPARDLDRVGRLTVKSRDVAVEPREVLRSLGVTEGPERVLVMTRRDGRVAQPADAASTPATRLIARASVPQQPPTPRHRPRASPARPRSRERRHRPPWSRATARRSRPTRRPAFG